MFRLLISIFGVAFRGYRQYRISKYLSRLRMREQLLLFGMGLAVFGLLCWGENRWREWRMEEIPAPYATMEAAVADGCIVVNAPGFLEGGEERWNQFFSLTNMGVPDGLSIAVWDGGEAQNVNGLFYDGEYYHYTVQSRFKHRESTTERYPYLLHLRYEPPADADKLYCWKESYVLTDKADLTGEEAAEMLYGTEYDFTVCELICTYEWKE